MGKKIILLGIIVGLILLFIWYIFLKPVSPLKSPLTNQLPTTQKNQPSETYKAYSDPSGFSFNYPDNLSISTREVAESTYADLVLSSKDVSGSINLKISDSKFKALDEWVKLNKEATLGEPKELKLGNIKAVQLTTADRLLLGAIDQGIFFNIEIPRVEEAFWMKVYNKILSDFSFETPSESENPPSDTVSFEGEEVVE